MNFQNLGSEHVEATHQRPQQAVLPSALPPEDDSGAAFLPRPPCAYGSDRRLNYQPPPSSLPLPQATADHQDWSPSEQTHSTFEVYGPDRFQGRRSRTSQSVRFDESQLAMFAAENAARMNSFKDELTLAAGKVTPGVDDSPYIQYALDALTRDRQSSSASRTPIGSSLSGRYSNRPPPQQDPKCMVKGFAPAQPLRIEPVSNKSPNAPTSYHHATPRLDSSNVQNEPLLGDEPALQSLRYPNCMAMGQGQWIPVDKDELQAIDPRGRTYQPLTFKPRILRPFSMIIFMTLSALMIVGMIFSAVYSQKHHGLTPYPGSIYSGQYFVFRILPQLLAGVILIYAQSIITVSLRILPFAKLAREDPQERYLALFQSLYPKTFLLPQLPGPWQLKAFGVATWLMNFTIPLQSAAFTVINDDGGAADWIWATTYGIVWTLVTLYIILLMATMTLMMFWLDRWTGLTWDVRSIADLIPLIHRTNTMSSYRRKGLHGHNWGLKAELPERWFDRLGYWRMEDMTTGGIWHTIGTSAMPTVSTSAMSSNGANWVDGSRGRQSNELSVGSHQSGSSALLDFEGGGYIPLSLRSLPLVTFVLVTGSLVLALLIVSFLPRTRLEAGFAPHLVARPNSSAFSAANFLYSFLPAALGMVLFLLFQSPDRALRILQPWADMGGFNGALASRSILADYAACLPFQASWRALRNGHWRVAVISLMSTLFIGIPVLAGGLFMALTTPDQKVRMFPNMPVFGVALALLILYVGGLCILIPSRQQFRLPHSVETVASIISFCTAQDLCADAAFRSVRSRTDLMDRLGVGRPDRREESVWFFGLLAGRDEKRLSVRRMRRYTEKMTVTRSMNSVV
ncbi:hypothetical protein E4U41_005397 [Claviceps citrina]|nr:hypothetical protein E4U41_005397 [Claviceps citrina]